MAQDSTIQHSTSTTVHLSALGAIKYPGIRAGIDYPVKSKIIERKKRKGTKIMFTEPVYFWNTVSDWVKSH